jgi:hypothetical protein
MGLISGIAGVFGSGSISRAQKRARKTEKELNLINSVQRYRQFVSAGRTAIADNVTAGVSLGLDSSASQGGRASTRTQFNVADTDFSTASAKQNLLDYQNEQLLDAQEAAAGFGALGGLVDSMISLTPPKTK